MTYDIDPFESKMDSEPAGRTLEDAVFLIKRQSELVMAIATQGPDIKTVEHVYKERRRRIRRALDGTGLSDPLPWASLWMARPALQNLGGWMERRAEVERLIAPVIEDLDRRIEGTPLEDDGSGQEATWGAIDERLGDMKNELGRAASLDDYQDVGRRCREVVAAAVNMVFTDNCMPEGEAVPALGDAKRRLDAYLATFFDGSGHDELRAFLRKLLALANAVTHDEESARLTAFAAAQGTISFVRIVQEAERTVVDRIEF